MKDETKAIKKVFIGSDKVCDRRKLDAQRTATYFIQNGHKIVTNPKKADIIVVFTCGVTNEVADISLDYVKKFMEYDGELIVAGCLPETDKKVVDEIFPGKKFSAKEMEKIDSFFPNNEIKFSQINDTNIPWINIDETRLSDVVTKIIIRTKIGKKMYIYFLNYVLKRILGKNYLIASQFLSILYSDYCVVRISQGCLNNCAYCAAKRAIGTYKSKPLDECVREFKIGLEQGFINFILTGDDTGAYGVDIDSSFPELLDTLTKINGCYDITIHALNPNWVVKYITELEPILRRGKIKMISIPVQSGSDRILNMMHRFSCSKKMQEALVRVKKAYPGLALDTHAIVGFPSETVDEFKETLELIKEVGFDFGSLIPLSIRPGTEIEKINTTVPKSEIKRRVKIGRDYLSDVGYTTNTSLMGGIIFSKKN
jgi:threonylcarbamoyladenosine tRNA methylthiotransferase CDKAL1